MIEQVGRWKRVGEGRKTLDKNYTYFLFSTQNADTVQWAFDKGGDATRFEMTKR